MEVLSCNDLALKINNKFLFSKFGITLFPGSILHLQGHNGSGKTSLLRMLSGVLKRDSGYITLGGLDILEIKKPYANYIGHNNGLKEDLTVLENLTIFAKLHKSELALPSALHYFSLTELIDQKLYNLSAGNKQKVALARLLACHANLWLLDEVSSYLDKQNSELLWNIISTKANNKGIIIITSHSDIPIKNVIKIDMRDFHV